MYSIKQISDDQLDTINERYVSISLDAAKQTYSESVQGQTYLRSPPESGEATWVVKHADDEMSVEVWTEDGEMDTRIWAQKQGDEDGKSAGV
jgi:hypothetical protein